MRGLTRPFLVISAAIATSVSCFAQINPWVSGTTYPIDCLVVGSDNNYYRSVIASPTDNPTTDSGSNWVLDDVYAPTTLTVSSGGRFTTLTQAYKFVASAKIAYGCTVTLAIAAGFTSMEPGPVVFEDSQGARLQVTGGTGSTLNFTTNTSSFSGIVINSGCTLSLLTGVSIVGHTINSQSTYNEYGGCSGILILSGASLGIQQVAITGFDAGVQCYGSLTGLPTGGLSISNSGDIGIIAADNGYAFVPYVSVSGVGNYAPGGLGFGIAAGEGGGVYCSFGSVANAANVDFYALGGAEMYAYEVSSSGPANHVYYPSANSAGNYNAIIWNPYILGQGGGGG